MPGENSRRKTQEQEQSQREKPWHKYHEKIPGEIAKR